MIYAVFIRPNNDLATLWAPQKEDLGDAIQSAIAWADFQMQTQQWQGYRLFRETGQGTVEITRRDPWLNPQDERDDRTENCFLRGEQAIDAA